jgi:hypothetical protein
MTSPFAENSDFAWSSRFIGVEAFVLATRFRFSVELQAKESKPS